MDSVILLKNTFSHLILCHIAVIFHTFPVTSLTDRYQSVSFPLASHSDAVLICAAPLLSLWWRHLSVAKEGFTGASLGLLANQRRRHLLTGLLKSLRTIKTLVKSHLTQPFCQLVWPDFWNDPHGVDKDWVIPTVAMPGETESSSCPSFVCSKELMFDSARCWRYCNPPAHTHTNAHAQRSAYNWLERSNAQKINPSLKVSCNIWRYLIMNDALLFIFFDVFYQLHL